MLSLIIIPHVLFILASDRYLWASGDDGYGSGAAVHEHIYKQTQMCWAGRERGREGNGMVGGQVAAQFIMICWLVSKTV